MGMCFSNILDPKFGRLSSNYNGSQLKNRLAPGDPVLQGEGWGFEIPSIKSRLSVGLTHDLL